MNYNEIRTEIEKNHALHWSNEAFIQISASDSKLKRIAQQYPDLYAQAQADFNRYLARM